MPKPAPTHLPHGEGRLKVEWPPVPRIALKRVQAVNEWLVARRGSFRPLIVAAPLMTMICALFDKNQPLPTRRALSEALQCNIFSVDAAISTALGDGTLTEEWRYEEGAVAHRPSIRRRRYLLPSQELYDVYNSVEWGLVRSARK